MLKFNKKQILNRILSNLYSLINKRKLIVFDAISTFHLRHFNLVISELANRNDFDIIVTGLVSADTLPNTVKSISDPRNLPLHRKISLFVTTEFWRPPYWLNTTTIFFGHGIGPKLNYASSESLTTYNYIFSTCQPIYDAQKSIFGTTNLIKVGLPVLEEPAHSASEIEDFYKIDLSKKTILYAPSWCNNSEMISDIETIVKSLDDTAGHFDLNIILSPHPNLFLPDRCDGKIFFDSVQSSENIYFNKPGTPFSTLDLVKVCSAAVSDISSILFEAMSLGKPVILDGNEALYKYSGSLPLYYELSKICPIPDWNNKNDQTILNTLKNDESKKDRDKFINSYIFNQGKAKDVFIDKVYEILSK